MGLFSSTTTTKPWAPQGEALQYGFGEAQTLYDKGPAKYYTGQTLAPFTEAQQLAQKGITGYAMGPEVAAQQAQAQANLGNVFGVAQGLPGLGQAYAQPAQAIAQGLPGLGERYAGNVMGMAGALPGLTGAYASDAARMAGALPGTAAAYAAPVGAGGIGAMGYGAGMAGPMSQSQYAGVTPFSQQQYQNLLSGQVNVDQLAPVVAAMGRDVQGQLDPILAQIRQGTTQWQPGGGTRPELAAGVATGGLLQNLQDEAAKMYASEFARSQDRRLQAAQMGVGQQQYGMGYGLQGGQLGLGAGGLATRGLEAGGQLGLGAGGLAARGLEQAGQLGLGAGRLSTEAAQAGGQLGLGAGQLATQAAQAGGQLGLGGLRQYRDIMQAPIDMMKEAQTVGDTQRGYEQERINRDMAKYNYEQMANQNQLNQYLSQISGAYGGEATGQPSMMGNMGQMASMMMMMKMMGQ